MIASRRKENNILATPSQTTNLIGKSNIKTLKSGVTKPQPIGILSSSTSILAKQDVNKDSTVNKKRQALAPKTPALSGIAEKKSVNTTKGGGALNFQPKKLFSTNNPNVPSTPVRAPPGNLKKPFKTPGLRNDLNTATKNLVYKDSNIPLQEQIIFPPPLFHQTSTQSINQQKSATEIWSDTDDVEYAPPKFENKPPELDFDAFDIEAVKDCVSNLLSKPMLTDDEEAEALKQWKKEDMEWRADLFEPEEISSPSLPSSLSSRSLIEFAPSLMPMSIPPTPPTGLRRMGTTPKRPLAPALPSKEFSPRGQSSLRLDLYERAGEMILSPVSRALSIDNNHEFDIGWTAF